MKRTALEVAAVLVVLFSAAILAGKAVESAVEDNERRQERKAERERSHAESVQSLREIGETMKDCSGIANEANDALGHCATEYRDCVNSLRECRDSLIGCALLVERATGFPIPRAARDAGAP